MGKNGRRGQAETRRNSEDPGNTVVFNDRSGHEEKQKDEEHPSLFSSG